mmetsp:Transcript_82402/g.238752  ORF Transcript_82402/g.238752 Transcript_82402/m.238752 type:complete len:210 (-) Transcript_82402:338-967(-)
MSMWAKAQSAPWRQNPRETWNQHGREVAEPRPLFRGGSCRICDASRVFGWPGRCCCGCPRGCRASASGALGAGRCSSWPAFGDCAASFMSASVWTPFLEKRSLECFQRLSKSRTAPSAALTFRRNFSAARTKPLAASRSSTCKGNKRSRRKSSTSTVALPGVGSRRKAFIQVTMRPTPSPFTKRSKRDGCPAVRRSAASTAMRSLAPKG